MSLLLLFRGRVTPEPEASGSDGGSGGRRRRERAREQRRRGQPEPAFPAMLAPVLASLDERPPASMLMARLEAMQAAQAARAARERDDIEAILLLV